MLLQAYDFLHLFDVYDCRLQLGGSDQWGNITMGIDLIRKARQTEVFGLTTPLVLGAGRDQVRQDRVGHGVVVEPSGRARTSCTSTSCAPMTPWWARTCGTSPFSTTTTIEALDDATAEQPEERQAQRALAKDVCTLVHGETEADRAEQAAAGAVLRGDRLPRRAGPARGVRRSARHNLAADHARRSGPTLVDVLVGTGLVTSKGQARTTISPGRRLREQPTCGRRRRPPGHRRPAVRPVRRRAPGAPGLPSRAVQIALRSSDRHRV